MKNKHAKSISRTKLASFSVGVASLLVLSAGPVLSQPAIVDGAFSSPNYVGTSGENGKS